MKKLVRISRIGAIVNVENGDIVLASPKEIDLKGIGHTNAYAMTGSFYDSIVEAKRIWKDLDIYTNDSNICFYKEVVIKDRHALHALIESLEGTTSRIVSIARCSIAEYNELRKGFMHPDFIEE